MSASVSSASTVDNDDHEWNSTVPQGKFWNLWWKTLEWALAFVAGFGSGKSEIMHYIAVMCVAKFPWANIAIYAPTYDLLKLNNIPRIGELLDHFGFEWKFNKQDYIFTIKDHGQIICRSMDNPQRIIAYEVFASFVDELDTMPKKRAEEAWNKIIARNRQQPATGTVMPAGTIVVDKNTGEDFQLPADTMLSSGFEVVNKCGVFTTPEGFLFTYQKWEKEDNSGYKLVRASTYSNPHLPKAYIENLKASYPPQLIEAYLKGEFVNLTGGRCYHCFDRKEHHFSFDDAQYGQSIFDSNSNVVAIA